MASFQEYTDLLLGLVTLLGGWWVKNLWEQLKDLVTVNKEQEKEIGDLKITLARDYVKRDELERVNGQILDRLKKIDSLEISLAKHYVTRDDLLTYMKDMGTKIDKIADKLDQKVDK